jgi:hypothetical protein
MSPPAVLACIKARNGSPGGKFGEYGIPAAVKIAANAAIQSETNCSGVFVFKGIYSAG